MINWQHGSGMTVDKYPKRNKMGGSELIEQIVLSWLSTCLKWNKINIMFLINNGF